MHPWPQHGMFQIWIHTRERTGHKHSPLWRLQLRPTTHAASAHHYSTTTGECLKDWLTVRKEIETLCDGFNPAAFITEEIAVLLCPNDAFGIMISAIPSRQPG